MAVAVADATATAPAAAATAAVLVIRTATVVGRRPPAGGRHGGDGCGRGRGGPRVRRQSFVLVLVQVVVVVVVERRAGAPPVQRSVVVLPVMVQVHVLLADHVDLLVPARLTAAAARRVVERQVHAGVGRSADPVHPTYAVNLAVFFGRVYIENKLQNKKLRYVMIKLYTCTRQISLLISIYCSLWERDDNLKRYYYYSIIVIYRCRK